MIPTSNMTTSTGSASMSKAVNYGSEMEYDLDGSFPPFGSEAFDQIKDLYSLNMYRAKSEAWAFKDIKFLVYDDSDETQKPQEPPEIPGSGYDSDDEESTLRYAIKLSKESATMSNEQPDAGCSHDSESKLGLKRRATEAGPSKAAKQRYLGKQPEEKDEKETPCNTCSTLPEFPHDRRPRQLRLFRPRDVLDLSVRPQPMPCIHYVSLSYCWPSRPKDDKGKYVPVEGTYAIRELDGSIRKNRALDEVLDRAVDFAQSCGLRMIWLDQECLPQADEDDREIALQAMDIVYNRAIITAGLHSVPMTSLNQIGAINTLIRVFGPPEQDSLHDVFLAAAIPPVLDFLNSVTKDRWYQRAWIAQESISASGKLHLVFPLAPGVTLTGPREQKHRFIGGLNVPSHSLDNSNRQLPAIQWSIYEEQFNNLVQGISKLYDGVLGQFIADSSVLLALKPHAVPILRAAAALRPIRLQRKFIPSMMGGASYGRRQKINAAGAFTIFRTRLCSRPHDRIAIMANMCGYDIRLDTRAVKKRGGSLRIALLALAIMNGDLSLFVPELYGSLTGHKSKDEDIPPPSAASGTTLLQPFNAGAHMIQYNIAEHGGLIRHKPTAHLRAHDVRRPGLNFPSYIWKVEDELDLRILKYQWEEIWQRLKTSSNTEERTEPKVQLEGTGTSPDGEEVRNDICLSPAFVQRNEQAQTQLSQIILSILRYLYDLSLSENSMATGIANSIWHSIRCGELLTPPLPDDVGPDLFDHPLVVTAPFEALQLDPSPDGRSYNQLWFVERIMANGTLWVGRCTPVECPLDTIPVDKTPQSSGEAVVQKEKLPKSIIDRQLVFGMIATAMTAISQLDNDDTVSSGTLPPGMMRNQGVDIAYLFTIDPWSPEAEANRVQNLVSVFDVDMPCIVATVYEADWEVLPRPGIRSLSTSWVVKRIDEDIIPLEENAIQEEEGQKEEDSTGSLNVGIGVRARQGNKGTHLYQVVTKVKGLWGIMEAPEKAHYFI